MHLRWLFSSRTKQQEDAEGGSNQGRLKTLFQQPQRGCKESCLGLPRITDTSNVVEVQSYYERLHSGGQGRDELGGVRTSSCLALSIGALSFVESSDDATVRTTTRQKNEVKMSMCARQSFYNCPIPRFPTQTLIKF